MRHYHGNKIFVKKMAHHLRCYPTPAEKILWYKIKNGQLLDVIFHRQIPLGNFIVDFYAPEIKLIVEVDGGHHFENPYFQYDKKRDHYLRKSDFMILRFNNFEIFREIEGVLEKIFVTIQGLKTSQG